MSIFMIPSHLHAPSTPLLCADTWRELMRLLPRKPSYPFTERRVVHRMTPATQPLHMILQMGISHRVLSLQGAAHTDYLLSPSQLCPAPPSNPPAIHTSNTTGLLANNPCGHSQLCTQEGSKSSFLVSSKFEVF